MMRKDVDILKQLIDLNNTNISINQLSQSLGMNYKSVYTIVKRLNKEGLISFERFGNSINCILEKKTHPLLFEAEFERRERLLKNKDFKVLYKRLKRLEFPFIALLFGSYAKNKADKSSDIDILIVCEAGRKESIENKVGLIPLDIHLVVVSYSDFSDMAKTKEFNVIAEVIKKNIILVGIEEYYRLIENVR